MRSHDEANIPATIHDTVRTPVVIEDEFRASIDMLNPRFDTRPATRCDAAAAAYLRDNPGASQFFPDDTSVSEAIRKIKLKLSRLPSGHGMYVDDLVEELKKERHEVFAIEWAIHQGRASRFWFVRWLFRADPVGDGSVRWREGQFIQPTTYSPPCSVDLNGERPRVFGKEKKPLRAKTQFAVQLLVHAYPEGLTTDELRAKYLKKFCQGDPFRLLSLLRKSDPDWQRAILMPGSANMGGRYGIAPDE